MQRREEFRSLASTLLAAAVTVPETVADPPSALVDHADETLEHEAELLRDVRLFRARVAEAVETAAELVIGDIAADVVARELELAPANLKRIVDRALRRYFSDEPLRVRVHPADAAAMECGVPVVADGGILRGDAIIELRDGYVDARLGVRLASVLRGAIS